METIYFGKYDVGAMGKKEREEAKKLHASNAMEEHLMRRFNTAMRRQRSVMVVFGLLVVLMLVIIVLDLEARKICFTPNAPIEFIYFRQKKTQKIPFARFVCLHAAFIAVMR